ncbi:MAG TPA: 4-alpha-glucanotransferase [Candidatus Acidoferrales bacterium]|nr:4-alpha-glucanotransferase [Candidatus Acidoferrales bacterium]
MSDELDRMAERAGIEPSFTDYFGNERRVGDDTKRALLEAMGAGGDRAELFPRTIVLAQGDSLESVLAPDAPRRIELEDGSTFSGDERALPLGYHRLYARAGGRNVTPSLVAVPRRCYLGGGARAAWALATQLYALRSQRNWGVGDFGDLARLTQVAAGAGAEAVALNPLHELFPSNPYACSPYSPSSRLFLNGLYVDVERVPELAESPEARALIGGAEFRARLAALRDGDLIDYGGCAGAKRGVLELVFVAFRKAHLERPGDARAAAFRRFCRQRGRSLERLARYEALAEHFRARDEHAYGWLQWPTEFRSPESGAVERFARERRGRVDFYAYVQWLADDQLAQVAASARDRGVGLYRDLAVGVELNGADAWSDPETLVAGASLGAPPDHLNAHGQNWGLPPLSPVALERRAFEPYAALLRANMRYATILRIDHVMALRRGFWIPRGAEPIDGAYVRYPFEAMLGVLALESVRSRCTVVGEDLGTVPEGFRERIASAGALSSRLVYFERSLSDGAFNAPSHYPALAAASVGTHDLPPLAGWWLADDITLRARIGLFPTDQAAGDAYRERHHARFMLVLALESAGAAGPEAAARLRADAERGGTREPFDELFAAVTRFLAATPCRLDVVALDDVMGAVDAVNVPGTTDQHPNWRRKHPQTLDELAGSRRFADLRSILAAHKGP